MSDNYPEDIADLKRLLNEGAGDDEINKKAIEIFERFRTMVKTSRRKVDISLGERIMREAKQFDKVIEDIERRRHDHALDRFKAHVKANLKNI